MCRIIFIYFFLFINITFLWADDKEVSVRIKGYYITRFLKEEILFSYEQKVNKIRGESYSTLIDYEQNTFFIPAVIGKDSLAGKEKLLERFHNVHIRRDTIFYLPGDKNMERLIDIAFNEKIDLSTEFCMLMEGFRLSPYYQIQGEDKYLYKCLYIEGRALKKIIENVATERFKFEVDVYSIKKESLNLNLFFLINVLNYSSIINIEGLSPWFPYLEEETNESFY